MKAQDYAQEYGQNCEQICQYIQDILIKQGYFHTDLYNSGSSYNCNNIVINTAGIPFPIDFSKMIKWDENPKFDNKSTDLKSKGIESIYFNLLVEHIYSKKYHKYKIKYLKLKKLNIQMN
jgi:hypothetical protein